MIRSSGAVSRRTLLKTGGAVAALGASGLSLRPSRGLAQDLSDPASVLARINVGNYVKPEYRELYSLGEDELLWDPSKDWIRTADWEAIREQFAGTTVRLAIGAADAESAAEGLEPFRQLSGIEVELVPIPDDTFYDKVVAEFMSGNASFDALQFFSPWLGDFAAPGFLAPLGDYAEKWGLPLDDWYPTYLQNYGYFGDQLYGIPFDCDIRMTHLRPNLARQVVGDIDVANSIPTQDDLVRISAELGGAEPGVAGVGLMAGRGFWSTYTWESLAAMMGMDLFTPDWEPAFVSDPGIKAIETMLALRDNGAEGMAGWGWGENRAAWLGGQLATNLSWQDSGTQATRPDQSRIAADAASIFTPRATNAEARFAPANVAGSTSVVTASSQNPEAAFLLLAFLTTASIMAMNEANANGVAPGQRSVLTNENLWKVSQPAPVWSKEVEYAWCAPRIPGMFEMEQALGNEINRAFVGQITPQEALENGAAAWRQILERNGFFSSPPISYEQAHKASWVGRDKPLPF